MIDTKTLRTGLAALLGAAVLLAGLIVGASIARADDADQKTVEEHTLHDIADRVRSRALDMCGRLGDVADQLGVDLEDLQRRVKEGATLRELAEEADIDIDAILDALRERITSEIEERVEDGTLDEERGNRLRDRIESFDLDELPDLSELPELGDFDFPHHFGDFEDRMPFGGRDWLGDLDLDLDIDLGELRDRLESGMTLDEALTDLGFDLDAAVADARESALAKIDEMVADGTIDEERADQLKEMIENFSLEGALPFGRDFHFDGFRDRGGWGEFHGHNRDWFGHPDQGSDDPANGEGVMLEI